MKKLLKSTFLLFLVISCMLSCNEEDGDTTPAQATFDLLPNSQIITEQVGENNV